MFRAAVTGVVLLGVLPIDACAQAYPSRPIRMIVPFSAGGPADATVRLVAPRLSDVLGQQVVIDNRGGGSGIIGIDMTAKAAPDGHTMIGISSAFSINATLFPKLPYDSLRDFAPVVPLAYGPGILVVHPSLPAKSFPELVALAKSKPRTIPFASSGTGSPGHLTFELLRKLTGLELVHVPYKGMGPGITDLLGGHVQLAIPTVSIAFPHVRTGRLRALAVTSAQRWPGAPDLPTIAESAVPGFESTLWYGILAPARTPEAIVARVNAEVAKVVALPEVRERFDALGMVPMRMSPAAWAGYIRGEIDRWAVVVRESGARPDS